jgi:hypothetical protein
MNHTGRQTRCPPVSRRAFPASCTVRKEPAMIILGVILLILGFVFGIPILWTIGIILVVAGAVLSILGATGRAIGGRKTWY